MSYLKKAFFVALLLIYILSISTIVNAIEDKKYVVSGKENCSISDFTNNEIFGEKLEKLFNEYSTGSYFNKTVFRSTQCMAFARYFWREMFGCYGTSMDPDSESKFVDIGSAPVYSMTEDFFKTNVKFGAHIRSGGNSHSMIYLNCDKEGIYVYHANFGPATSAGYLVEISYYDWARFKSTFSGLSYIYNPILDTVTLDTNGGIVENNNKREYIEGELPTPKKEGFEFTGWTKDKANNNRVYANWEVSTKSFNFKSSKKLYEKIQRQQGKKSIV